MTATKFRDAATRLRSEAADKRRERDNNTPKRAMQEAVRRIEADHAERTADALECLAAALADGSLPPELAGLRTKKDVAAMLTTRPDHSGGYYSVRDTGEFHDQSDTAKALRAFVESRRDGAGRQRAEQGAAANRIADLERDVRFRTIPGFFPTPPEVIAVMLDRADIGAGQSVLEPSAGKGDIADAVRLLNIGAAVTCFEISSTLRDLLGAKGHTLEANPDFLTECPPTVNYLFDRVLMNPPFEKGQDIAHVRHAFEFLRRGGRLVSLMSAGPFFRSDKRSAEFRDWLDGLGADVSDLPDGSFKGAFRSTGVQMKLVVIDRP